jgi:hypothetical protein
MIEEQTGVPKAAVRLYPLIGGGPWVAWKSWRYIHNNRHSHGIIGLALEQVLHEAFKAGRASHGAGFDLPERGKLCVRCFATLATATAVSLLLNRYIL